VQGHGGEPVSKAAGGIRCEYYTLRSGRKPPPEFTVNLLDPGR